eukprot:4417479-Pyramimonas_sp.AAC.1
MNRAAYFIVKPSALEGGDDQKRRSRWVVPDPAHHHDTLVYKTEETVWDCSKRRPDVRVK